MTETFDRINKAIFRGKNPYDGFDRSQFASDLQGWNSTHKYLQSAIVDDLPNVVIEIGVWKGGSSIFMAKEMKKKMLDGVIIAIDTFLGSWELYEDENFDSLRHVNGYPTLFYTFMSNVIESEVQDYVCPLPLDSSNAFFVMDRAGIQADAIHIDGGHDYDAVVNDMRMWWKVLKPGGVMILDDYDPELKVWPSVKRAVDDFIKYIPHNNFESSDYKARLRKPIVK